MFESIFPEYIAALNELPVKKRSYLAIAIVEFVNKHLEFFRCLKKNHLDYMIIEFFDNHIEKGRDGIWNRPFSDDEEIERIFMMTISVEHYNIIRLWLELCDRKTPEKWPSSSQTPFHCSGTFNNAFKNPE